MYSSIQSAINNANSGDTIDVAAGTYTEQLTITKSLTIVGDADNNGTTTVQSPATLATDTNGSRNLVTISGNSVSVDLGKLTVSGPPGSGSDAIDTGIFVEGGATASIHNDSIVHIRDNPLDGTQSGVGIQVGQAAYSTVGTATIQNDIISDYQKDGIAVDGSGSSATISGTTVTGAGPTPVIAQNGIQISRGASGMVSGDTVSNNQYTGSGTFGVGIFLLAPASGTSVTSNGISGNDFGIYSSGATGSTTLSSNTIVGVGDDYGIYNTSAGMTTINGNTIDGADTGIDSDSSGSTTLNNNNLGLTTPNTSTGIEIDEGTVNASTDMIVGSGVGIDAVSYDGNVALNLNGSTITNSTTGIAVDSTPGSYTTTVTTDNPLISPPTMVTSNVSGAHGAVITGEHSKLIENVPPTLAQASNSPTLTNNPSGSYNAVFNFSGHDNITSANDLVYQYQLDGGPVTTTTSPLTLNNLSQGSHTVKLTVLDQGGQSATISDTFSNVPVVQDGGFETPVEGSGNFQYQPSGSPWTFSGLSGISGNGSAFTSGNPVAPEGVQVALLQNAGSFSQSVNFQATGSYTLSFSAAQRGNYGTSNQNFQVLVDGTSVGTFQPSSTSYQALATPSFTVSTAGFHTITFVGLDSVGGDNTALIDNVVLAVAVSAQTPVVRDGGFETPVVGTGSFQYQPSGSPWTFSGLSGISGNNSAFTSGNPPAPEGVQVAILQTTGSFSQSVSFASAGTYTIAFLAAQRGNNGASAEDFQVLVDNQAVGTFKPSSTSYQALATPTFTVSTAGFHAVTFVGLDSVGGDNTAFIDNVSIAVASQTPTVPDGGFETPVVGTGNFQYQPSGSPWTFNGNSGIAGNNSAFTSGNPPAPEGVQVAILQTTGSFSQSVSFASAGTYTVSFLAAQRGNTGTSTQNFQVLVDGMSVGTFQPSGTSYQSSTTMSFSVAAGSHTIAFVGLDSVGGDNTAFIDNVTIAVASQTPPVADGGFETPVVGSGNFQYQPSGSPWTFNGNSGIAGNNSAFTSGNPVAPEGVQVAFLQTTGSFSQSIDFQAAGSYTLSFLAAQRGNIGTSVEDFEIMVDNQMVGTTFQPSGTSYQSLTSASFAVAAGFHTITFVGLDTVGGDNTALIDNITLAVAS